MSSDRATDDESGPLPFPLSQRAALGLLIGLGAVLAGIVGYDVYADWMLEGKTLGSTVLENILPMTLSLALPAGGAWLARSDEGRDYLSTAATWAVLGGILTLVVAGLTLGFQLVQREIKPYIFVTQMMTAGALAGLLVGWLLVEIRRRQNPSAGDGMEDPARTPLGRMHLGKQAGLALLVGVGAALAGTTLFDVYADWILEGKPIWSTLIENVVPLLLALAVPASGWQLARAPQGALYVSEAAKWTLAGTLGVLVMAGVVVGLQLVQGELKPGVILTQMATFGAVAGLFVGYTVARARRIRRRLQERKERLQKREARLRGLANSVPGGLFQFEVRADGTQGFTYVSKQTGSILGISIEPEGYFDRFVERVPSPHREALLESIESAVQEEAEWSYEMPFDRPDGERIWVHGISTPETRSTPEGETLVYHGVLIDITDRRESEWEARRRADAMAMAADGMAILDAEGRYVSVNQAHAAIYGYDSPEAMVGTNWKACYSTTERRRFEEGVMPRLAAEGQWRGEATGRRVDGTEFPQEVSLTALDGGGIICVVRDITERKTRERKLRQRGAALDQAGESVLITEAEPLEAPGRRITYVNEAFEEMTGYSEEEILGQTPRILQGPETDPEVIESLRAALQAGAEWEGETVNYRKNGEPYIVNWDVAPVRGADGEIHHWVSTQRDVTEKRRREDALRQAKAEAEEASRLKSAMLANMSHELRTPLTSIIGFAEALAEEARAGHEEDTERFAGLIEESGRRLMDTLTNLMELSKLEAGQMELAEEPVPLGEVAQSVAEQMVPQAQEADVTVEVKDPEATVRARADERGVEMAVSNLLENAIKYTEPGGTAWVRVARSEEEAVLEVEDTGIGVEPDEVDRLFEAFEQESEGLGREYEGTGLGLSIVQELAEQMGGTVHVESEKGEGSCFALRLPRVDGAERAQEA